MVLAGQEAINPPCSDTALRTSTPIPPSMTNPSTTSKLSSSLLRAATSGKYQPAGGGGWRLRPTIQQPTPLQNAPNGPQCGNRSCPSCDHCSLNSLSSVLSQDAAVLELGPYPNNQVLNASLGPTNVVRSMGPIPPIDPAQSFPLSPLDPVMHRRSAHAKASRNPTQRFSLPDRARHQFTSFQFRTFLTMVGFSSLMFLSTIAELFDIIWHSAVRHQVAAIPLALTAPRFRQHEWTLNRAISEGTARVLHRPTLRSIKFLITKETEFNPQ